MNMRGMFIVSLGERKRRRFCGFNYEREYVIG